MSRHGLLVASACGELRFFGTLRRQSRSARAASSLIQRELQRASSAQQVLTIIGTHLEILDARNASFAIQKIAALQAANAADAGSFQRLLGRLEHLVSQLESKELAKLCSSLSTLRVKGDEKGPWFHIVTEVTRRLHESQLTELDICESLRALARVPNLNDLRAFDAAESMEVVGRMSFHGMVTVMWAMAIAAYPLSPKLLDSVHSQLNEGIPEATLKLIAVAAGKGRERHQGAVPLMVLVARLVEVSGANALSPAVLRTLLWASVKTSAVGVAIGMEAVQQLADQGCHGLAAASAGDITNFAWAVACVQNLRNGTADKVLQVAAAEALRRRDFDANHLATLLWAASPGSSAGALAELLALHVPKLPENLLLRSAKAQLKLQAGHSDAGHVLLDSICAELLHRNSAESETKEAVSPSTVASIACALAESSSADTQRLFTTLEPLLAVQAGSLPPNDLARLTIAAARLKVRPTKLLDALVVAVSGKARQLHPKDLQRVAQSLAELKVADCEDLTQQGAVRSAFCGSKTD